MRHKISENERAATANGCQAIENGVLCLAQPVLYMFYNKGYCGRHKEKADAAARQKYALTK